MWIEMLETKRGSEDGHIINRYYEGVTYDVADTMGAAFIHNGWAKETKPDPTVHQSSIMDDMLNIKNLSDEILGN